jgi:hypothetical protein
MPTFFHGTRRNDALAMMPGAIDVSLGGGEFGRGFYTQSSAANALTWVQHLPAVQQACVLALDIDDPGYAALTKLALNLAQARRLTRHLRAAGTTRTYQSGRDVTVGPLNGSNYIEQQKFESASAQGLLNGPQTKRSIL